MESACVPLNGWMDKEVWTIYTMRYYSAIKKKEVMSFAGK
jgi:hypothetical protein